MKYIILAALFLAGCTNGEEFPVDTGLTIKKVGGCNKYGNCGVLLSDNTSTLMYFPVEGCTVVELYSKLRCKR